MASRALACIAVLGWLTSATPTAADEWVYVVAPGDTLIGISQFYLAQPLSWPRLQRLNRVAEPRHLQPGTRIRIPVAWLKVSPQAAEVLWIEGEVRVAVAPDAPAVPATPGSRWAVGARLETGPHSAARIRLADGSTLLVAERSRVLLRASQVFGRTGMTGTTLSLPAGTIETDVTPQRPPAGHFEIQTPVVATAVRGTSFRVAVALDGAPATRVEMLTGTVELARAGEHVPLAAGFGARVGAAGAIAPTRLLPAPDLASWPASADRTVTALAWSAVPGAARYRVQVFAVDSGGALVADTIVDSPRVVPGEGPGGAFLLRVRAVDADGFEGFAADRMLTLLAPLPAPALLTPGAGARVYDEATTLTWSAVPGADAYDIEVAADAAFATPALTRTVAATSLSVTLPPGTWAWRLAARAGTDRRGAFSEPLSFERRRAPDAPAIEQTGVGTIYMAFFWQERAPGLRYEYELASDPAFATILGRGVESSAHVRLPRPAPGTYYMRIRALTDDNVAGPYTETQHVEVRPARPHVPTWWWLVVPAVIVPILIALR